MGKTRTPEPAKLFCAFIGKEEYFERAKSALTEKFGEIDYESGSMDFDFTDYYEKEMGRGLKRRFVAFSRLIEPSDAALIKNTTNSIEMDLSPGGNRTVNIDPGYVNHAKVVLLTTKDYFHRVYLKDGIYAEVTLHYRDGKPLPFPWTYPDYRTDEYIEVFRALRDNYAKDLLRWKQG